MGILNRNSQKRHGGNAFFGDALSFAGSEAYKRLRTNIIFSFPEEIAEKKAIVIGVTSSVENEHKTTTSINLACSFAELGKRVLIIDGDMRNSYIAGLFKLEKNRGLSNCLVGEASANQLIYSGILNRPTLDIMLSGSIPPNPVELLESARMHQLMSELRNVYDYIILDLPPVLAVTDPLVAAQFTDGMLIVIAKEITRKRWLRSSIAQLKNSNAKIIGVVATGGEEGNSYQRYKKYSKYGSYGSYGYGYSGYYGKEPEKKTASAEKK